MPPKVPGRDAREAYPGGPLLPDDISLNSHSIRAPHSPRSWELVFRDTTREVWSFPRKALWEGSDRYLHVYLVSFPGLSRESPEGGGDVYRTPSPLPPV